MKLSGLDAHKLGSRLIYSQFATIITARCTFKRFDIVVSSLVFPTGQFSYAMLVLFKHDSVIFCQMCYT